MDHAIGTHATGAFSIALGGSSRFAIPNRSDSRFCPTVPRNKYQLNPMKQNNAVVIPIAAYDSQPLYAR